MNDLLKRVWIIIVTLTLLYSVKLPILHIKVYFIVLPVYVMFILLHIRGKKMNLLFVQPIIITSKIFVAMLYWGVLLTLCNDTVTVSANSIAYFISMILSVITFAYIFKNPRHKMVCEKTFFVFSSIIALSGIYEAITGDFYHLTHVSYVYNKNMFGLSRPNTIFYNINDSAVFMSMSIVISFILSNDVKQKKAIRVWALIVYGLNILFTESRGAILGMAIFLFIIAMEYLKSSRAKLVFLLISTMFIILISPMINVIEFSDFNLVQMAGRGDVWRESLINLSKSYFLGTAPGNTVVMNSLQGDSLSAVHNFFLEISCDYGLIGFVCVLIWFTTLLRKARTNKGLSETALIIWAGLIAFIPLSISSSSLIGKSWVLCFFGIITAELCRINSMNYKVSFEEANDENTSYIRGSQYRRLAKRRNGLL